MYEIEQLSKQSHELDANPWQKKLRKKLEPFLSQGKRKKKLDVFLTEKIESPFPIGIPW